MSDPTREPRDYVILGGQRSPGIATIEGADSPRRLVKRRGYGLSGATVRFAGVELSEFKIVLKLLTSQDWTDWNAFRPLVQTPPLGEREHALDVEHPFLEELGIRAVLVENVSVPKKTAPGEWTIEIAVCEYREPVAALSAPSGATQNLETANEREIRRLTAEFNAEDEADSRAGAPEAA